MATALTGAEARRPWVLLAPTLLALIVLMIAPICIMGIYSFFTFKTAGVETTDLTTANWREFFTDPYYWSFLWKTFRVSLVTAVLCVLLAYAPAYFIAMTTFRHKWLLLLLLIVPFWISFTIRTFSWIHILGDQGAINASLVGLGIIATPIPLLYNEGSVVMGMIHFLLPYAILNIYVSLEGIDRNLISAARTLGCTELQAFREVTLPLSLPGLGAGFLLSFVLAAGSYVTPQILGGRSDSLFGNLIFNTTMTELNWPMGTTLSVVLLVLLGIVSVFYSRYMGLSQVFKGLSR